MSLLKAALLPAIEARLTTTPGIPTVSGKAASAAGYPRLAKLPGADGSTWCDRKYS